MVQPGWQYGTEIGRDGVLRQALFALWSCGLACVNVKKRIALLIDCDESGSSNTKYSHAVVWHVFDRLADPGVQRRSCPFVCWGAAGDWGQGPAGVPSLAKFSIRPFYRTRGSTRFSQLTNPSGCRESRQISGRQGQDCTCRNWSHWVPPGGDDEVAPIASLRRKN